MSLQNAFRVLALDDDRTALRLYEKLLQGEPALSLDAAVSLEEAALLLKQKQFDVLLIDLKLGESGDSGFSLLAAAKALRPSPECVVVSAEKGFESVQRALRLGADDYIVKGFSREEFDFAIKKARERKQWKRAADREQRQAALAQEKSPLLGQSPQMQKLREQIEKLAKSTIPVFIHAETGAGKELVARQLHLRSQLPVESFVAVDCPNIPQSMAEGFLFGHERGAFTGAERSRPGIFEEADGGTLFLDEVGSLTMETQSRLLRVLQEKEFCRLGSARKLSVDFRLVSAANQDLEKLAAAGSFKSDLLHRLQGFVLNIPPLRERKADISELCTHFLPGHELSAELLELLMAYAWPGNIRELQNCLRASAALAEGDAVLAVADLPEHWLKRLLQPFAETVPPAEDTLDYKAAKSIREQEFLSRAYLAAGGNVSQMARALKLDRSHLHQKLKVLGIHAPK